MIKYYLRTSWRNLKANKFYSLLNIAGLTIGLAAAITLLLWVDREYSYDKFNPQAENIYRINNAYETSDGDNTVWTTSPAALRHIGLKIKGIKDVVRIYTYGSFNSIESDEIKLFHVDQKIGFVDSGYFKMFALKLLKKIDRSQALPQVNSVVLSNSMAQQLWGKEDPIGKVVYLGKQRPFYVSGVMRDIPQNSSIPKLDIVLPMRYWANAYDSTHLNTSWKTIDENYGDFSYHVYAQTFPSANLELIADQITSVYSEEGGESVAGNVFTLQQLKTMHLIDESGGKHTLHLVQIFGWLAILILLIASVNYINLSTARALIRAKEVGIRKIVGAGKRQLFWQFIAESNLIIFISLILSILLVMIILPIYNQISGNQLNLDFTQPIIWQIIFFVAAGTFLATAIYPALMLARFKPIQVLKGGIKAGHREVFSRKLLVVLQFTISGMIIISAIVMMKQMNYIKSKDLGYDRSFVFVSPITRSMEAHTPSILHELDQQYSILGAAFASGDISNINSSSGGFSISGRSDIDLLFFNMEIGPRFLPTMKLKLIEGQNFTGSYSDTNHFILNQKAVDLLHLSNPIGTEVRFQGRTGQIWGVVRDFNFQSLRENIGPIILTSNPAGGYGSMLYVKAKAPETQKAIEAVSGQFEKFKTEEPFNYSFLDKRFESQYTEQKQIGDLIYSFASIAIFISCLGLFGLATYTATARTKEIGIRKVLGASISSILKLISKEFLILVGIAVLIATPIAFWIMSGWLEGFAFRTNIGISVFIYSSVLILLIASLAVGFKAHRAARANPTDSLKME